MKKHAHTNFGRAVERWLLAIVTITLCVAFLTLHNSYRARFAQIEASYADRTAINLDRNFDPQRLINLLVEGAYVSDENSAIFIVEHIKSKLEKGILLPNLGSLNKSDFRIAVESIDLDVCTHLAGRVAESYRTLGITVTLPTMDSMAVETVFDFGDCEMKVSVQENDTTRGWKGRIKRNILQLKTYPTARVLVQITKHDYDSLDNVEKTILGYAITGKNGIATFKGLDADGYYSVLPIQKGFEYGASKGTTTGSLGTITAKKRVFLFTQREHQISPFEPNVFAALKEDNAITVRTPHEYQSNLTTNLVYSLLLWWLLHFYLFFRKKTGDQLILPIMMTLSGICLLIMYAINNPVNDLMIGTDIAKAIMIGVIITGILSEINMVTLFNANYKFLGKWGGARIVHFDIVRLLVIRVTGFFNKKGNLRKWVSEMPEGAGYLILALSLTCMLFPFGTGPTGSGVKVNLFFFQPGEIAKYMIVVFLAAFFYHNAKKIQTFSETFSKAAFNLQFRTVIKAMICLGVLLGMYLVLGDMGPALVIGVTFIIIYSVVRRDLPQLIVGTLLYVGFLVVSNWLVPGSKPVMLAFTLVWVAVWLFYGLYIHRQKQLFESAIFFNLIIFVFVFGGYFLEGAGMHATAERMMGRTEICIKTWDNEIRGGDQVAQGLWALASGGITGQGLGQGNPNLVPAFHTDMVFTSIGEETGWIGLLLIMSMIAFLLYRSLLIGQHSGHPFAFYLATGIAVVTGVQFLMITMGSIGLIPLTGIAVPFLSYGNVSMIMNFIAFAIVFSISNNRATANQKEQLKKYALMIETCKYGFIAFAVVILGTLFWYQSLARDATLIRPALISSTQGERMTAYNPRIHRLMRNMDAGNIYDRSGKILLATSDKEQIRSDLQTYIEAGVSEQIYQKELNQRKRRYYPFGENLFFWLGDFNQTDILWTDNENDPRGYITERRHLAALRGFDNLKYTDKAKTKIKYIDLTSKKYKGTPFAESRPKEGIKKIDYDYNFLLPYLKAGINSRKVELFNEKREKRDIVLTVDATLQTQMQNAITAYVADNFKGELWNKLRVSVVVLNAKDGDLLCSANYPLPNIETLREKRNENVYNEKDAKEKAYTDRDLGLTYQTPPGSTAKVISALAGLKQLGTKAATGDEYKYRVYYQEIIEKIAKGSAADEPTGVVSMEDAIVKSSNCYFVNLVNKNNLYDNLGSIYQTVGIRIDKFDTKMINGKPKEVPKALTPYFFTNDVDTILTNEYKTAVSIVGARGKTYYDKYIEKRNTSPNNPYFEEMNWFDCAWAWGQGSMSATPLNMARIAGIVANDGFFVETQYVKQGNKMLQLSVPEPIGIVSPEEAKLLKGFMQNESARRRKDSGYAFPENMGGKTGTPEREMYYYVPTAKTDKTGKPVMKKVFYDVDPRKDGKMNDGWYVFFIDSPKENAPLAVAVRMERLGTGISGNAVRFTDRVVLKVLSDLGYSYSTASI